MNALHKYLERQQRYFKHDLLKMQTTPDQGLSLNSLVVKLDATLERMNEASAAIQQANDELSDKMALVKLSSGQKNPTLVRIRSVAVSLYSDNRMSRYSIELSIELVESKPFARLRYRSIPLEQLIEVLS